MDVKASGPHVRIWALVVFKIDTIQKQKQIQYNMKEKHKKDEKKTNKQKSKNEVKKQITNT